MNISSSGYLSGDGYRMKEINENYQRLFPLMMHFIDWFDYDECVRMAEALKQLYFGDDEIGFKTAKNMVDVSSVAKF